MNNKLTLALSFLKWSVIVCFILSLSACATLDPKVFPTRDNGNLIAPCDQVYFIVSLNSDDDNDNKKPDLEEKRLSSSENNLREIVFPVRPDADQVYIAEPVLVPGGTSAVGTRVRGWKHDGTPFQFNSEHDLPVQLFIEGIKTSDKINDIGFEYQYKKKPDEWRCGGSVLGTVVEVSASLDVSAEGEATDTLPNGTTVRVKGKGTPFKKQRKMLILGTGKTDGKVSPNLPHEWLHPRGTFRDKNALQTDFTAGTTHTPRANIDNEPMLLKVTSGNQRIEAHFPVNITAPLHLQTKKRNMDVILPCRNKANRKCWFDANRGSFTPVPTYRIKYKILDQERKPIKNSAYAGVLPQIRENIGNVMTSPIPAVNQWIRNSLSWTQNWKSKPDGHFTDKIEAYSVNKNLVVVSPPANPGRRIFHTELRDATGTGILMHVPTPQHHIWFLGVNRNQTSEGTRNDFSSVVEDRRPAGGDIQIRLRTRYTINTP